LIKIPLLYYIRPWLIRSVMSAVRLSREICNGCCSSYPPHTSTKYVHIYLHMNCRAYQGSGEIRSGMYIVCTLGSTLGSTANIKYTLRTVLSTHLHTYGTYIHTYLLIHSKVVHTSSTCQQGSCASHFPTPGECSVISPQSEWALPKPAMWPIIWAPLSANHGPLMAFPPCRCTVQG
jgi:hypothetical protein